MRRPLFIAGPFVFASLLNASNAAAQHSTTPSRPADQVHSVPWLVTVLHQVAVDQLLAELTDQGWRISVQEELTTDSPSITNVTTGMVMDRNGQILTRLVNANARTKPSDLTITTGDGRILHPDRVRFDNTTGYAVLHVPDLNVEPPAFARGWTVAGRGQRVRLLYHVPMQVKQAERGAERAFTAAKTASVRAGKSVQNRVPYLRTKVKVDSTWVTFPDGPEPAKSPTPRSKPVLTERAARARTENAKQFRRLEVASLTPETDGSVVLNSVGQVVGLAQFVAPDKGVLRSVDELKAMLDRLGEEHAKMMHGWLGISLESASVWAAPEPSANQLPVNGRTRPGAASNVVIKDVIAGSPAAQAGLKANDLVLSFNSKPLTAPAELADLITRLQVGTAVPIQVWRDGAVQTINVELQPRPDIVGLGEKPEKVKNIENFSESPLTSPHPLAEGARNRFSPMEVLSSVGLRIEALSPQLRSFFGITDPRRGVLVTEVLPATAAQRAGLRAGDVIVKLNETDIATPRGLALVLSQLMSRRLIQIEAIRDRAPRLLLLAPANIKPDAPTKSPQEE